MSRRALLVIDMLNDFIQEGAVLDCGPSARQIIPFVQEKIEEFHEARDLVVFVCDNHQPSDPEFDLFPPHCVSGTPGAQIIPQLEVKDTDIILPKKKYSAFFGTNLEEILQERQIGEVHVVGVCTSICVMDTVGDLRNRDYQVIVYRQGVADFDAAAHTFALQRMETIYGAKII
jgi:nicotinamidase-related amidase